MKYLYHYDGVKWQRDSVPVSVPADGFFQITALEGISRTDVFAIGYMGQSSLARITHYFYHKRSVSPWAVVDSFIVEPGRVNKWGYGDLWVSPSGTLYSCGDGVHKWNGSSWQKVFEHRKFISRITGTSDKNIFVVGHFGTVLHFNGEDWFQFQQFANADAVLWGVWTDGTELFVVGFTASFPQKTIILHGR